MAYKVYYKNRKRKIGKYIFIRNYIKRYPYKHISELWVIVDRNSNKARYRGITRVPVNERKIIVIGQMERICLMEMDKKIRDFLK